MPINFHDIKHSIQDGAEVLANKSKRFAEISSLNIRIMSSESSIKNLYKDIGEEFYNQNKHNKKENNLILNLCKEIDEINDEIKSMKKKILKLKEEE